MSDEHTCGLSGCSGSCDCGGHGYVLPGKIIEVCRCKTHLYAAFDAAKWECPTCGVEGYGSDPCGCDEADAMWGDQDAPTRGFLGDAAW